MLALEQIKADIRSMKVDFIRLNESVRALNETVASHQTKMASEVTTVHNIMDMSIQTHTEQLSHLSVMVDDLDSKLTSINSSMRLELQSMTDTPQHLNSGHDIGQVTNNSPGVDCGGTGWRRVVYLNMSDTNATCPAGWQLNPTPVTTCGRVSTGHLTCDSVTFPVCGGDYTRVCGRVIAYQVGPTDAFEAYDDGVVTTIDGAYVSGVSLTHGSPRQHIWTFAAGATENQPTRDDVCPCDATVDITTPSFVGGDYFCESGWNSGPQSTFNLDDPLWDGAGCTASSTCCSFNCLPYFIKQLPCPTSDDIEARICQFSFGEDTPIEFMELYVQ